MLQGASEIPTILNETAFGRPSALVARVELSKGDSVMGNRKPKKCAPCRAAVKSLTVTSIVDKPAGDARSEEVEIACDCSHLACPLTA